ncbi:MAG: hypothetical protein AB3X41_11055 [Leptothrix ochracea]|nr:hypothetical protein [Leptothrix ochracea]
MPRTHQVAIIGFSRFELETLVTYFRLTTSSQPGHTSYRLVRSMRSSELILVDTDLPKALNAVQAAGRASDCICIGRARGFGNALAYLPRPIDALRVKRVLDQLIDRHSDTHAQVHPDLIELPRHRPGRRLQ